jgi:hypothetical protein
LQREAGWKDNLVFSEYFHRGNGAGLGAAHQTEWTGVIAGIIYHSAAASPAVGIPGHRTGRGLLERHRSRLRHDHAAPGARVLGEAAALGGTAAPSKHPRAQAQIGDLRTGLGDRAGHLGPRTPCLGRRSPATKRKM